MPGPAAWLGEKLVGAVGDGSVSWDALDAMALRMLRLLDRAGRIGASTASQAEESVETPAARALARRIAAQATVLLTNGRGLLPLDPAQITSIAVIGPAAHPGLEQGGGSAQVSPHRRTSPLDGLREALPGIEITTARGCSLGKFVQPIDPTLLSDGHWRIRFWAGRRDGDPVYEDAWADVRYAYLGRKIPGIREPSPMSATATTTFTPDQTGAWLFQLACAGRATVQLDGRGLLRHDDDGPTFALFPDSLPTYVARVDLQAGVPVEIVANLDVDTPGVLPQLHVGAVAPDPAAEIARAADIASRADVAVLVVGTGPEFESEGLDRQTLDLPGAQPALVEAVLAAQPNTVVVVSAGAPVLLPWCDRAGAVVWGWFAGQEAGHALADVLLGNTDPGGRLPTTFPQRIDDAPPIKSPQDEPGVITYSEGTLIGYRWYEAREIEPRFAFGHGLSYADIDIADPCATAVADGGFDIRVVVHNRSKRDGSEVVQVYVDAPPGALTAPPRQLAGFARVQLRAGETGTAVVRVRPRALAFWDVAAKGWCVPAGRRVISIGRSSADRALQLEIDVDGRELRAPQP
jgi:beta-glucosidase